MRDEGQEQVILGVQIVNQDSGIVITVHLPHQEPPAEREGPCVLWQLRAYP